MEDVLYAIMNSVTSNRQTLAQDDINGAQYLYGAQTAPTPTPTPSGGSSSLLANISTRLNVGAGENVMIAGFVVRGPQSKTVIVRALGPSLSAQGITNPLTDPALELHASSNAVIASNDDWPSGSQVAQLSASGFSPSNGNEAALIATLAPGSYTVTVHGYNGGTGMRWQKFTTTMRPTRALITSPPAGTCRHRQ